MNSRQQFLLKINHDTRLTDEEARSLATRTDTDQAAILDAAARLRDMGHGEIVTYSRKVFIPLTELCRDVCHYCTFAKVPKRVKHAFLTPDEVLAIATSGAKAGCKEALFTLGDKPELRYQSVREELAEMGHQSTLSYLAEMADRVFRETGLLPHLNPGVVTRDDLKNLKQVSVSQGIMLESSAERLCYKGGPHYGSPDKQPMARLDCIRHAGQESIPLTTGILIGIGETRMERIESLLKLRELHDQYGHIQEIIVQNFRAKAGTKMATAPEPSLKEQLWTIAMARLIFGSRMSIQAPPNLQLDNYQTYIAAGINDWGGVSPVTPDHVNPEAPWPQLQALARQTQGAGKQLVERLAIYPGYICESERWLTPDFSVAVLESVDAMGLARCDDWYAGASIDPPLTDSVSHCQIPPGHNRDIHRILGKASDGVTLTENEVTQLFASHGADQKLVCDTADQLRQKMNGDSVTYVVNRNINYTNLCYFNCRFCAFSKGKSTADQRERPYMLELPEIVRRAEEAWTRGATEVCLQGGIHPDYNGETYLGICQAIRQALPDMHIHAFSPLEVWHGATTLGMSIENYLAELRKSGLGTLPGTAAEILDDEVRAIICPDKINTEQWLQIMRSAHQAGLKTTATIMFGHVERPEHWARHLLRIRRLQISTGGFTEFVPLPFVHEEAPMHIKGQTRLGPSYREAVLMHAVARLVLHPHIQNIQTSWTKMGPNGALECLQSGANDLGGTLMNESITRAAGARHGQEFAPEYMDELIQRIGRNPRHRTTSYARVPEERVEASYNAPALIEVVNDPVKKRLGTNKKPTVIRPNFSISDENLVNETSLKNIVMEA